MTTVGKAVPWTPQPGRHRLAIIDREDRIVDAVHFEVRGSSQENDAVPPEIDQSQYREGNSTDLAG